MCPGNISITGTQGGKTGLAPCVGGKNIKFRVGTSKTTLENVKDGVITAGCQQGTDDFLALRLGFLQAGFRVGFNPVVDNSSGE
jgi:hypothetical protein